MLGDIHHQKWESVGRLDASKLCPGMAVTVEIKTGRRPIISYRLSLLARRVEEAGRERGSDGRHPGLLPVMGVALPLS
jgi:hypothetical protein